MILVGEETGNIGDMLLEVADFYEIEIDADLKNLSSAIEPLLLVIIGAMVLVLALGIFLPMWNLLRRCASHVVNYPRLKLSLAFSAPRTASSVMSSVPLQSQFTSVICNRRET